MDWTIVELEPERSEVLTLFITRQQRFGEADVVKQVSSGLSYSGTSRAGLRESETPGKDLPPGPPAAVGVQEASVVYCLHSPRGRRTVSVPTPRRVSGPSSGR